MKCPKCGFTSFDFLESCKKCGADLQDHKSRFGLRSLLFPGFKDTEPVPSLLDEAGEDFADDVVSSESSDFGFDFMTDDEPATTETLELDDDSLLDEDATFEFEEDSFTEELEIDEPDELWDADAVSESEPQASTEKTAEPLEVDDEIDFDNWESEIEEEFAPPGTKEDPSDPFDVREPADSKQASEEINLAVELIDDAADAAVELSESTAEPISNVGITETRPAEPATVQDGATELVTDVPQTGLFEFSAAEQKDAPEPVAVATSSATSPLGKVAFPEFYAPHVAQSDLVEQSVPSSDFLEEVVPIPPLLARVSACLTDMLILAAIFLLFLVVGEMTVPDPGGQRLLPSLATLLDLAVPYFLVLFTLCFGYFTLFHFLTGQTPGKMVFKLRVESITGEPLLFSQAFLRSTGGLFSLLAVGLGYLTAAFNSRGRGWNDLLAGSRMVPLFAEEIDDEDLAPLEI
jgi:uncharacterized RDD family membrane protein YckC